VITSLNNLLVIIQNGLTNTQDCSGIDKVRNGKKMTARDQQYIVHNYMLPLNKIELLEIFPIQVIGPYYMC